MIQYMIEGGKPLHGTVTISGAKNAAVAILPATLLVDGTCRIENVPDISDVRLLLEILDSMGAQIRRLSLLFTGNIRASLSRVQIPAEA